jgi:hypothetical protein
MKFVYKHESSKFEILASLMNIGYLFAGKNSDIMSIDKMK